MDSRTRKLVYSLMLTISAVATALAATGNLPSIWVNSLTIVGLAISTFMREFHADDAVAAPVPPDLKVVK